MIKPNEMKIIIVGAGDVGHYLCQILSEDGHSVTLIESSDVTADEVEENLDVRVIRGNGASAKCISMAGADSCDFFMAMTAHDQLNIVACSIAHKLGAKTTIARVHDQTYSDNSIVNYQKYFDINVLINPEALTAIDLAKHIRNPERVAIEDFARGQIELQELIVTENAKVLGCKSDLEKIIKDQNIKEIILAPEQETDETVLAYIRALYRFGLPIKMSVSSFLLTKSVRMSTIYASPMIDINKDNMPEGQKNIKNTFDRLAAALFLVLFSPLYLYLAWRVKRDSPGGIFYRQERLGLHGKPFTIYKFRTMRQDAEASGPALSSENDPRITPFGHVMRKYRFDELPQFWNVLKGDMSLVGPRPERSFYAEQIMEKAPFYCQVYTVKPGITSWGMVKYGYAKTVDQMTERLKYDIIYLDNRSLFIDIKILIYTVRTIVTGKGI